VVACRQTLASCSDARGNSAGGGPARLRALGGSPSPCRQCPSPPQAIRGPPWPQKGPGSRRQPPAWLGGARRARAPGGL